MFLSAWVRTSRFKFLVFSLSTQGDVYHTNQIIRYGKDSIFPCTPKSLKKKKILLASNKPLIL